MPQDVLEYDGSREVSLPLRSLARFGLSLPPAWLIIASFLAYYDLPRGDAGLQVAIVTFYVFWASLITLVGSLCEWLCDNGNCGPLLLHVAAAVVVLIACSHLVAR